MNSASLTPPLCDRRLASAGTVATSAGTRNAAAHTSSRFGPISRSRLAVNTPSRTAPMMPVVRCTAIVTPTSSHAIHQRRSNAIVSAHTAPVAPSIDCWR